MRDAVRLAVLLLLVAGCEKKRAPAPADAGKPRLARILVGEVGTFSGPLAVFGNSMRRGIELAMTQENKAGGVHGVPLALRPYDDHGNPAAAANAVTRLVTEDGAMIILGGVTSDTALAMGPRAQAARVPMISPTATHPRVTAAGDYVFRVCFSDQFQGYAMARFAREQLRLSTAAVLKGGQSDYSNNLAEVFTRKFTEFGGKVVAVETYDADAADAKAALTPIVEAKPEAVYIPGYDDAVARLARQLRGLGLEAVLLGPDGWASEGTAEAADGALEGGYFTDHYSAANPNPRVQRFIGEYRAAFGVTPDAAAALGYDAARVAVDALRRAPELTGPAIRSAIASTRDFPGVAGTITIEKDGDTTKPLVVLQVTDGGVRFVNIVRP